MNEREIFFQSLARLPERERAAVLVPAFHHADDDERALIAAKLSELHRPGAVRALITRWDRLEPASRRSLAQQVADPQPVLADALHQDDAHMLRCSIDFIRDRGDGRLAGLLVHLLQQDRGELRRKAAGALLQLVVMEIGSRGAYATDGPAWRALDHAVGEALDTYRAHRLRDVLLAAAIMVAQPGPALRRIIEQPDHPGVIALRSVPQHLEDDLVRANMIRWLAVPIMQRPALRWVESVRTAGQWNDVLAAGHLLLAPARQRLLRRHPRAARLLPSLTDAVRLDSRMQTNVVDWVRACGLTTPRRVAYLGDLVALPSPLARVRAANALARLASGGVPEAVNALRPFARDNEPSVARLARRARHNALIAREAHSGGGHEALIRSWPELNGQERARLTSRLASRAPDAAVETLRLLLRTAPREQAIAAMTLAERVGLADRLVDELRQAMRSDEVHVAASAVREIGRLASENHDAMLCTELRRMIHHEDARVRANAVEALVAVDRVRSEVSPEDESDFSSLAAAAENRLRANAVRAMLLRDASSAEAIRFWQAMARDERPLHRISAIWVAGRAPHPMMLDVLHQLCSQEAEPVPEVRTRAAAAARWLECFAHDLQKGDH